MTDTCTITDCARPRKYRLYCQSHYERNLKYGDPLGHAISYSRLASPWDRFWSKVDSRGVCWEWTASQTGGGYGHFLLDGRHQVAHRIAWEWLVGPIPAGLQLDHLCRNRNCVNPDHLEPVTIRENLLRGSGWAGRKARQTHCIRGHELIGENLIFDGRGHRTCRACSRQRAKRRRAAA